MNQALNPDTQAIVVDEIFLHAPTVIWKALTSGELIGRWLMAPKGFEPVAGSYFTFQTMPAGDWNGTIHCEVLEVVPNERLSYAWKGGHEGNDGYGSKLETAARIAGTLHRYRRSNATMGSALLGGVYHRKNHRRLTYNVSWVKDNHSHFVGISHDYRVSSVGEWQPDRYADANAGRY